jgi:rhodanese-related sulfurtransferase
MTDAVPFEIDAATLDALRRAAEPPAILDVREPWETDICVLPESILIPLGTLPSRIAEVPTGRPVVVMCHHGARSAHATAWLRRNGFPLATNLEGGIDAWARTIDPSMKVY